MSKLTYVSGDATRPSGDGPRIIVHVCNDIGGWGASFVLAVSRRWDSPEESYRRWHREGNDVPFELGQVQFVQVEDALWVANLLGQHGVQRRGNEAPIRYDAVRTGLMRVAEFAIANGASAHMPRIGCGLAGGSWNQMEPIIVATLVEAGVKVTVYDLACGGAWRSSVELRPLVRLILERYSLPVDGFHGVTHWARVLENGRRLAAAPGANIQVVSLFAVPA